MLGGGSSNQSLQDFRITQCRGHLSPNPKMYALPFSLCLFFTRLSERPKEVKELECQAKTCPFHTFIHSSVTEKFRILIEKKDKNKNNCKVTRTWHLASLLAHSFRHNLSLSPATCLSTFMDEWVITGQRQILFKSATIKCLSLGLHFPVVLSGVVHRAAGKLGGGEAGQAE